MLRVDSFMRMNITSYRFLHNHPNNASEYRRGTKLGWNEPFQVYEFFYEDGPRLMEPGLRGDEES